MSSILIEIDFSLSLCYEYDWLKKEQYSQNRELLLNHGYMPCI